MTRRELAVHLAARISPLASADLIADMEADDALMALAADDMDAAFDRVAESMHARLDLLLWELRTAHANADAA